MHYADIVSALDLTTAEPEKTSQFDDIMQAKISALGVTTLADAAPFVARFAQSASGNLGRRVSESRYSELA